MLATISSHTGLVLSKGWTFCHRLRTVSPITCTAPLADIILRSKVAASSGVTTCFCPHFKKVDVAACSSCSLALLALVLLKLL